MMCNGYWTAETKDSIGQCCLLLAYVVFGRHSSARPQRSATCICDLHTGLRTVRATDHGLWPVWLSRTGLTRCLLWLTAAKRLGLYGRICGKMSFFS